MYVAKGDTFPHRDLFKSLGWSWRSAKKVWTLLDAEADRRPDRLEKIQELDDVEVDWVGSDDLDDVDEDLMV